MNLKTLEVENWTAKVADLNEQYSAKLDNVKELQNEVAEERKILDGKEVSVNFSFPRIIIICKIKF